MNIGEFWELGHVADGELQNELRRLLANGSRTEARIVAHLAAVEERRLHLEAGCSSLFGYCCAHLGLSESEAFHRITAARLARRFPLIFAMIARREIHLTGVCLLRDFLTPENHGELLAEAVGKTKLQVQELLARRFPRPDIASSIRKLPDARAATRATPGVEHLMVMTERVPTKHMASEPAEGQATATQTKSGASAVPSPRVDAAAATRDHVIEPRSAGRYRIQFSASAQLKEKLERAVDLLSHSNPSGDLAEVFERALDLLIEQTQKRRFAQTKRPRPDEASGTDDCAKNRIIGFRKHRRHVSNATKRQIVARDGLRCSYVSADGERCRETKFIQIHHEHPWARGGRETPNNLRIVCAAHNRLLAEKDFGRELVATRARASRAEAGTRREDGPILRVERRNDDARSD